VDALLDPRFFGAIGLMVLLTIAPGPDMALVTSTALSRGRRAAVRTALGISTGTLIWATLSGFGVAALLAASAEAYSVIRIAGAAYLIYLGLRALRDAASGGGVAAEADRGRDGAVADGSPGRTTARPFRQGLLTNLLNPKVGLFYTTLVPQIVDPGDPVALVSIAVGIAHATIGLAWLALLAMVVDRAGDVLRRPRIRRMLAGATGAVLIAFGLRVAAERG
jgi:RhtB (resistance to homoserine/threonine) family protein